MKNSKSHQPTYKEISAALKFGVLKKEFFILWDCPMKKGCKLNNDSLTLDLLMLIRNKISCKL